MGQHDELCLLSGICPGGGPDFLLHNSDLDRVVAEMADEIKSSMKSPPPTLTSILHDALILAIGDDRWDKTWKPSELGLWPYFDICIAIGYFDQDGRCDAAYCNDDGDVRAPGGRNVEVRRVYSDNSWLGFNYVVRGEPEDDTNYLVDLQKVESYCTPSSDPDNPNFFVLEGCYRYLEAWLDWDGLPSRSIAFPDDPEPMSLASEFYEIVNSRTQPRNGDDPYGILPCISYGGMENTSPQYQDHFLDARSGSKWTGQAIAEGLRGRDLIPPLMRDFGCWMCMQPDIWPTPQSMNIPEYKQFEHATTQGYFHILPVEILLDIFKDLPISSILALSTTCQFVRNHLTNFDVLNAILRAAVLSPTGSLRWLLPVRNLKGETERAISAGHEWLTSKYALVERAQAAPPQSPNPSPFLNHSFPYHAFVPACLTADPTMSSMSMSSRRRFWDIIQQFELIWKDYRTKGWERDIFSMFGVEEFPSDSHTESVAE